MCATETCPNCGYCKHCGRSNNPQPVIPLWVPAPCQPNCQPNCIPPTIYSGGTVPAAGCCQTFTINWSGK